MKGGTLKECCKDSQEMDYKICSSCADEVNTENNSGFCCNNCRDKKQAYYQFNVRNEHCPNCGTKLNVLVHTFLLIPKEKCSKKFVKKHNGKKFFEGNP